MSYRSDDDRLPHDLEAEAALLGGIILSESALYSVLDAVRPEHFYVQAHRLIYEGILSLAGEDRPVDVVTLRARLEDRNTLRQVGGIAAVSRLVDALPDVANIVHYAQTVRDHATRRALIEYGREVMAAATNGTAKDALDSSMEKLIGIAEQSSGDKPRPIHDLAEKVIGELEDLTSGKVQSVGVRSGLAKLDNTVLMRNGRVIVLAGATSSGKSSLALQIADLVATAGKSVAFFSLEMSGEELATRIMAARSGLDHKVIESGPATSLMLKNLRNHLGRVKGTKLFVDDNPSLSPLDIRARARQIQLHYGLDMVVVDYLQLANPGPGYRGRSRQDEVAAMSRGLKITARALGVPMLVLSQLSRKHLDEKRKPELRDLRESGSIENDADAVVMVYRPDLEKAEGELLVRKQRQGPLGKVGVKFDGKSTRFTEVDPDARYLDDGMEHVVDYSDEEEIDGDLDF